MVVSHEVKKEAASDGLTDLKHVWVFYENWKFHNYGALKASIFTPINKQSY